MIQYSYGLHLPHSQAHHKLSPFRSASKAGFALIPAELRLISKSDCKLPKLVLIRRCYR